MKGQLYQLLGIKEGTLNDGTDWLIEHRLQINQMVHAFENNDVYFLYIGKERVEQFSSVEHAYIFIEGYKKGSGIIEPSGHQKWDGGIYPQ